MNVQTITTEVWGLVKLIRSWIAAGLSADEIRAKLADPDGVGADMLRRAVERRQLGAAYLGAAEIRVAVATEPEAEPAEPIVIASPLSVTLSRHAARKRGGRR